MTSLIFPNIYSSLKIYSNKNHHKKEPKNDYIFFVYNFVFAWSWTFLLVKLMQHRHEFSYKQQ